MTLNNQRLLILFKFPLILILLSCQFVEIEMSVAFTRQATRIATEIVGGGVVKASKNLGGENLREISHQFKHSGNFGKHIVAETGENAFLKTKHSFKSPMPHPEKHWTNKLIDFKRLYSHGLQSPTFLFSPKGKVFNYSTPGELFDKIKTKKEKSKEMLKQILDYIFTVEDKKVEKLFKKLNKIRKNYNTLEKYAKNASNLEEAKKLIVKPKDFWKDGEDEENPFAELFERVTKSKLNIGEMDPEIVEKINQILKDEGILVEDKIEKISEILDEMNDNGKDFVEEEY